MAEPRASLAVTAVDKTAAAFASANKGLRSLGQAASAVRAPFAALGSVFAVSTVMNWAKGTIDAVDALGDFSKATGIGVERLQELRYAAKLSGVEVSGLDGDIQQFAKRLGEFQRTGGGPAADLFKQLPIQLRDASGQFLSVGQSLDNTLSVITQFKDEAQLAALANLAFGRSGADLVPLLKDGSAGIAKMSKELRDMGGVIGTDTVAAVQKLDDQLDRIGARWEAFKAREVVSIVGAFDVKMTEAKALLALINVGPYAEAIYPKKQPPMPSVPFTLPSGAQVDLAAASRNLNVMAESTKATGDAAKDANVPVFDFYGGLKEVVVIAPKFGEALSQVERAARSVGMTLTKMPKFVPFVGDLQEIDIAAMKAEAAFGQVQSSAEKAAASVGLVWQKMPKLEIHDLMDSEVLDFAATIGRGLRDTFVDLFMGIDVSFRDLLKRMAAEAAVSGLFKGLATLAGGPSTFLGAMFGGFRAKGGPLEQGKWYVAGERGAEPVWGGGPGAFAYAGGGSGGGVGDVHVHIEQSFNSDLTPDRAITMGQVIAQSVYAAVNKKLGGRR